MIIQFIRHMETKMNQKGQLQGSIDSLLSKHGIEESYKFVDKNSFLDVDVVYCSDLGRARFLAKLISDKANKELVIDKRLNEISLGEWQGLTWKEVMIKYEDFLKDWYKDSTNIPAPGGESYLELKNRINQFIVDLKENNYKKVIVVTHGALIKTLVCSMLDIDLSKRSNLVIDNGSITEISIKKYKVKINKLNSFC